MPISTMTAKQAGHFGWFMSDGKKRYLRKDGSVGHSTLDPTSGEYSYWPTEEEAQEFLTKQQEKSR